MEQGKRKKRVVVFGIFDGIHEGHRFLFEQAKQYGDELVAVVGRDSFVRSYKQKEPRNNENVRVALVQKEPLVDRAVLGDEVPSSWNILEQIHPDVICLGYDQDALGQSLQEWGAAQGANFSIVQGLYREPADKV